MNLKQLRLERNLRELDFIEWDSKRNEPYTQDLINAEQENYEADMWQEGNYALN